MQNEQIGNFAVSIRTYFYFCLCFSVFSMSKLLSSQEFSLRQVNAEDLNSSTSRTFLNGTGNGSTIAAGAILTPQIQERPEWTSMLVSSNVPVYLLPKNISNSSVTSFERKKVHYVADKFDRQWLERRKNGFHHSASGHRLGQSGSSSFDLSVSTLEDIFTLLELEAQSNPEVPLELIPLSILKKVKTTDSIKTEIKHYWLRKRHSLGRNIPCISLRLCVEDENQSVLCRPEILGDCPIPFKQRDWVSAVAVRCNETISRCSRKRIRYQEEPISPASEMCTSALDLCYQLVLREQLHLQHTYASLYELSSLRNLAVQRVQNSTRLHKDAGDGATVNTEDLWKLSLISRSQ